MRRSRAGPESASELEALVRDGKADEAIPKGRAAVGERPDDVDLRLALARALAAKARRFSHTVNVKLSEADLAKGEIRVPGAQLGDAVFVGVLHFGLTGDQPGQDVVAKREIGGGRRRPHAEQHDGADDDPEHHRADPDLLAGMDDGVAMTVEDGCGGMWSGAPGRRPAVIMGMVVVGTMTGTVRHRHSRAGRR